MCSTRRSVPTENAIITVGFDAPTAVMWDADSGTRLLELKDDEEEIVWVDFSRDGRMFVTASKGDVVRIRASADGRTLAQTSGCPAGAT